MIIVYDKSLKNLCYDFFFLSGFSTAALFMAIFKLTNVLSKALAYQPQIENLLNRLPYKNLAYIITPEPLSEKSLELSFPEEIKLAPDQKSEKEMFDFVNKERNKRGIKQVIWSEDLNKVARSHCLDREFAWVQREM